MIALLAQTTVPSAVTPIVTAATSQPSGGGAPWIAKLLSDPFTLMIGLIIVFYIFMWRTSQAKERQKKDALAKLKEGDVVQTIGGMIGTVIRADEKTVVLKVDENSNTKIKFTRSAIHRVVEDDRSAA
jgi:preprotein translocase subunit YajC